MKDNYGVNSTATNCGGVGTGTILFIVFLILKLTHVINWSWWWVTAPLWISFGLVILFFIVLVIIGAIVDYKERK